MSQLEIIARMKIRPGQLDGFKAHAAELMRAAREQDTQTIRYDWFVSADGSECEVHEAYVAEAGLIEHNTHVLHARERLFRECASDHRMSVYGDISPELADLGRKHAGGFQRFVLLEGIDPDASSAAAV